MFEYGGAGAGASGGLTKIADTTLGAAAASFDITGIPGTYRHLLLHLGARDDTVGASWGLFMTYNGDTGANYDVSYTQGGGGASGNAFSAQTALTVATVPCTQATANTAGHAAVWLLNYAGTTFYKAMIGEDLWYQTLGTGTSYMTDQHTGLWRSTAAINRITLAPQGGNLISGSFVTLYGL